MLDATAITAHRFDRGQAFGNRGDRNADRRHKQVLHRRVLDKAAVGKRGQRQD